MTKGAFSKGIFGSVPHVFVTDIENPRLQRHFALIGRIPLLWSEIEFCMMMVLGAFDQGDLEAKQRLIMAIHKIGNRDRPNLLEQFVDFTPMALGKRGNDCAMLAVKAYEILNQNRNLLLHSHAAWVSPHGKVTWIRFTTGKGNRTISKHLTVRELTHQIEAFKRLRLFLLQLYGAIWSRQWAELQLQPWPRRFPLPKRLQTIEARQGTQKVPQQRKSRPPPPRV